MPATQLSQCSEVMQEVLGPWCSGEWGVVQGGLVPRSGGCARVLCSSCKGGQGLEMHKGRSVQSFVVTLKQINILLTDCWADQETGVASNRLAGLCGLGTFWPFIPKASGVRISKKVSQFCDRSRALSQQARSVLP